jgi:hypothetical protein
MATMKKILLLILTFSNASFATTQTFECGGNRSRFDGYEEYSKPIYFTKESESEEYSSIIAHIPIPVEFKQATIESTSLIFFVPSVSKAPLGWATPEFEKNKKEVLISFGGIPKTELEARVRVSFTGKGTSECKRHLVATYKFADSTKNFRSVFE